MKFTAWIIGSWENEKLLVYANGEEVIRKNYITRNKPSGKYLCGSKFYYDDRKDDLSFEIFHDEPWLVLKFTATLNETANEDFGISNVEIYYISVDENKDKFDGNVLKLV